MGSSPYWGAIGKNRSQALLSISTFKAMLPAGVMLLLWIYHASPAFGFSIEIQRSLIENIVPAPEAFGIALIHKHWGFQHRCGSRRQHIYRGPAQCDLPFSIATLEAINITAADQASELASRIGVAGVGANPAPINQRLERFDPALARLLAEFNSFRLYHLAVVGERQFAVRWLTRTLHGVRSVEPVAAGPDSQTTGAR